MNDETPGGVLYKILPTAEWRDAQRTNAVNWSADDHRDGFMHLSTAAQVLQTARRHFRGQTDLTALEIDPRRVAKGLKFEPSRGGELFPHLYGILPTDAVMRARALVEDGDGEFRFVDRCEAP